MGSYFVDTEHNDTKIQIAEWPDMSLTELYQQKNILITRLNSLISMQADENFCRQVQRGITQVDMYIDKKTGIGGDGTFV